MTPYRSLASAPARPALTWWQRVLVRFFTGDDRASFMWYRAHIGGRWCVWRCAVSGHSYMQTEECPAHWHRFTRDEFESANVFQSADMRAQNVTIDEHRASCTCEVYPYPALPKAESFETWRRRIDSILAVKDGER